MRDAVRRLLTVRPSTRIVQVRVPAIIAGRRGLPVLLSAFAVVAAASTAATTTTSAGQALAAPAGTTVLPQVVPPTYSYPGSSQVNGTSGAARPPGGTGLNGGRSGSPATSQLAANGIPGRAVQAYQAAAVAAGCGIPWTLVAAIGRVESDHGRFARATLLADGRSDPPIVGIPLDGRPGVAVIKDTDGGRWDGDTTYDRAVGPMQFIPGSWATFGVDGDGDGKADPFDIDDAAASAAKYLCKAGGDLSNEAGQRNAVYSYNRSTAYVDNVMALAAVYAGHAPVDNSPARGGTPGPISPPTLPPGTIGDPPAAPGSAHRTPTPTPTPPKAKPTSQAPTTTHPPSPAPPPKTTRPSAPAATTTRPSTPAPTSSSPSATPSPTCTPSPSPSPSGTNTPNATASAAATPTASPTPTGTASANATGTPTPSPSPTLPPCPS